MRERRAGRRLRRAAAAPAVVMALIAGPVSAQTIDLPRRVDPPALSDHTHAMELWGVLEMEMAPLIDRERSAPPGQRPALRASINYRIIAADLLARGHQAGRPGSLAVVAGTRLADQRAEVDAVLRQLQESPGPDTTPAALAALDRFNDGALHLVKMPEPTDAAELDENLRRLLDPLADAARLIVDDPIRVHWPRRDDVGGAGHAAGPGGPAGSLPAPVSSKELRARVAATALPEDTRQSLVEILDYLDRGETFPELKPRVESYRGVLSRSLDLVDAVDGADWLTEPQRESYHRRLHEAVTLFRDRQLRERGLEKLDRLDATRQTIARISALHRRGVDLRPIRAALISTDTLLDNVAEEQLSRQQLARLMRVLDRMVAFRELENVSLRRELRAVEQQLRRRYRESEAVLVKEIETLTANPEALADPAFSSLLRDHAQFLEDLQRVRDIPRWIDAVAVMNPAAGGAFGRQARKMAQWLLDDNRRPDAIRAIEQFEQQLDLFSALPHEPELRQPTPPLAAVTGNRERELLGVIRDARSDWAASWGRGDGASPEVARMLTVYRLMQTIADVVELGRLGDDASALNRWAAWHMPPESELRTIGELRSRLKLATDAAVKGDAEGLARQLERMDLELPFVKLMGRLAKVLGPTLAPPAPGVVAVLGQSIHPPPPDAWWLDRRVQLAELCRYAMERDYAEATGQEDLEWQIAEFVNALADDLLRALGDRRGGPPALIGFDGSDPEASDIDAPVGGRR